MRNIKISFVLSLLIISYVLAQESPVKQDSSLSKSANDSSAFSGKGVSALNDSSNLTFKPGNYFGFGAGAALGNLPVIDLWKRSLCSSLEICNLTDSSFSTPEDKSDLKFTVLEKPDAYDLGFPLSVNFLHFNENSFISTAASFFMINKQYKAIISSDNDSMQRKTDLKQTLRFYTVSLDFDFGKSIPREYFSIDGVDKSFFTAGFGVSPIVSVKTGYNVSSTKGDIRMQNVKTYVSSSINNVGAYGAGFTFRAGLTTVHNLRRGALQTSLLYSCNLFDYFRKSGSFINNNDIYSEASDGTHRLSFLSNRIELRFTFLRGK
jgi:hypothetical protein